ncbi:MAG: hypothetical protein KAV40_03995 [Thermoplasmatales archaeon]|nr:hypothetical protein [Thermoplasmatales archaeon]
MSLPIINGERDYKTISIIRISIKLVKTMGRRQTMMEKYKQQMKAYRKKRGKIDSTPFLPSGGIVYVMNSLNPDKKIKAEVLKTRVKNHREVVESLACPECGNVMSWDSKWEAFTCEKHEKRAIYEIVLAK